MTALKAVGLSGSFSVMLPEGVCDQRDERVSSSWLEGKPLLLQLSSYIRTEGAQLSAQERLAQRMAKHQETWRLWKARIHPDTSIDQASAEFVNGNGFLWVHSYLVWTHLAIYATISGPEPEVRMNDNWAANALRTITLTVQ
jgi:hypothetical protein